jgi:hypothetical protein
MGVDLIGRGGSWSCNWGAWYHLMEVAHKFGWNPQGTIAPDYWQGEWDKVDYFSNSFQTVTDSDARAIGMALLRAVSAAETEARAAESIQLALCRSFADYTAMGGFDIG